MENSKLALILTLFVLNAKCAVSTTTSSTSGLSSVSSSINSAASAVESISPGDVADAVKSDINIAVDKDAAQVIATTVAESAQSLARGIQDAVKQLTDALKKNEKAAAPTSPRANQRTFR